MITAVQYSAIYDIFSALQDGLKLIILYIATEQWIQVHDHTVSIHDRLHNRGKGILQHLTRANTQYNSIHY